MMLRNESARGGRPAALEGYPRRAAGGRAGAPPTGGPDGSRETCGDGLDPRQREAVEHGAGPLLILAGPGSGKTRVLCHRIAKLVERGADPGWILAVTFTRKAAGEILERLHRMTGRAPRWTMTFHSLCTRMLRADSEAAGLPPGWDIVDASAARTVVKKAVERLNLDSEEWKPAVEQARISARKNHGRHGRAALAAEIERAARFGSHRRRMAEGSARIHAEYDRILAEQKRLDFDDLLLRAVTLLDSTAGPGWIRRWDHVLVDEFQDTNLVQYEIMARLCRGRETATIVGDPDQSIYGWRGAKVGNIGRYREEFRPAVIELDANYRSTPHIVQAARALMESAGAAKEAGDEGVARRALRSARDGTADGAVHVVEQIDDLDEAEWVRNLVVDRLNRGGGIDEHRIAVLYRINALSKPIEDALGRPPSIPYSMSGGVRFYDRAEVQDAAAYLRVTTDPADDEAFERILNRPPRGLGKEARQKIRDADRAPAAGTGMLPRLFGGGGPAPADAPPLEDRPPLIERCSLALRRGGAGLTAAQRAAAAGLLKAIDRARAEAAAGAPASAVLAKILDKSGYLKHLKKSRKEEDQNRLENVDQLIETAKNYERRAAAGNGKPPEGIRGFLDEVALMTDREPQDEKLTPVHLMTMHAAKGLEFPTVAVVGAEDGLCPLKGRGGDDLAVDYDQRREERRLFYVGMTRAEETLCISHARRRKRFGRWRDAWPSPYVRELPAALKREDSVDRGEYDRDEHEPAALGPAGRAKLDAILAAQAAAQAERRRREAGGGSGPPPDPGLEAPSPGLRFDAPPPGAPEDGFDPASAAEGALEPPAWLDEGPPPADAYGPAHEEAPQAAGPPEPPQAGSDFERRLAHAAPWPPPDVRGRDPEY